MTRPITSSSRRSRARSRSQLSSPTDRSKDYYIYLQKMTFRARIRFEIRKIYQIGFVGGIIFIYIHGVIRFPGNIPLYYILYRSPTRMQCSSPPPPPTPTPSGRVFFQFIYLYVCVRVFLSLFYHTYTRQKNRLSKATGEVTAAAEYRAAVKNFSNFLHT